MSRVVLFLFVLQKYGPATSFIPQQVRAAGLEMKDVMTDIIENEFN